MSLSVFYTVKCHRGKNEVDYYYITLILELQTTQCAICKYSIIERDEAKQERKRKTGKWITKSVE